MKIRLQNDSFDCGLVIIQTMYKYFYNIWLDINSLKQEVFYKEHGISIEELRIHSKKYDMQIQAYEGNFESFKEIKKSEPFVCLIKKQNYKHFVIVNKIIKNKIIILDPAEGKKVFTYNEFEKIYDEVVIFFNKTIFKKENISRDMFEGLSSWPIIISIAVSLFIIILSFISTFYFKIILDNIIPLQQRSLLLYITISFIFIFFLKTIINYLKKILIKKIEINILEKYIDQYYYVLFSAPYLSINKITKSSLIAKFNLITSISTYKANFLNTIFVETITFIASFIFLLNINITILIFMLLFSCIVIIIYFLLSKKNKINYKYFYEKVVNLNENNLELINSLSQSKFKKREWFIIKTENNKKAFLTKFYSFFKYDIFLNFVNEIFQGIIPILIIYLCTLKIFSNEITIGEMIVIMGVFNFLISPLEKFVFLISEFPLFEENRQNIDTILTIKIPDEGNLKIDKINKIELERVSYSFERGKDLFYINNLVIDKSCKITGRNGCGKSTFLKIISSLFNCKGRLMINEINLNNINKKNYREKIFFIDSNTFLPSSTIVEFLTNNDEQNFKLLTRAMQESKFQDILNNLNLDLSFLISSGGENLSLGQKQIIMLLPLLIYDYDLIILDEAFENIDNINFEILKKEINKRFSEKIIIEISHRNKYITNGKEINFEKYN
ncbi:MAG: Mbov_0121 family peptidase domain-containing ABC transporter [Metamycoplasmataceae bacterium]